MENSMTDTGSELVATVGTRIGKLIRSKVLSAMFVFCATVTIAATTSTFTTLLNFEETNGAYPGPLILGKDGNFYGISGSGGANGYGSIFKITPQGKLTSFCSLSNCLDGRSPDGVLAQGSDGSLYGITTFGGSVNNSGDGTVFKLAPDGTLTTVYNFCSHSLQGFCIDGLWPGAGLIQASDGNFYGTTNGNGNEGFGTVFTMTPQGVLDTLYVFCSLPNCADGRGPVSLIRQGSDGNFYGSTQYGGNGTSPGDGTIFKITPKGGLTTLYSFCSLPDCADDKQPLSGLIQASDGDFYGTTTGGVGGFGTVFKITPQGTLTTLYNFCSQTNCTDGEGPFGPLLQASDGNFYGTTSAGGTALYGTIFRMTASGVVTTLQNFDVTNGSIPSSQLVQGTNGVFYGTTYLGGSNADGTVFSLSLGLFNFPALSEQADYFAENKSDYSVWRPSTGTWHIVDAGGKTKTVPWGAATDIPVIGDFDGDRRSDIALFRPSTGTWWIVGSRSGATISQVWGEQGDIPVPGDYDGDGKTDYAVFRPSTGTWWILESSTGQVMSQTWGEKGDIPVPGDYDGDGKTDYAVFRPSTGAWWIVQSSTGMAVAKQWGASGDEPVPGDYDGDGKTDVAIWRPSTGTWWIVPSSTGTTVATAWGGKGDVPVPRDYDGDGKTDIAVWRPSTGTWWILPSSSPGTRVAKVWGASTDIPINKPVGQ